MCVFISIPVGVVSVEVATPEHVLVLSAPYIICVIAEEASEDGLRSVVITGVIYIEDG